MCVIACSNKNVSTIRNKYGDASVGTKYSRPCTRILLDRRRMIEVAVSSYGYYTAVPMESMHFYHDCTPRFRMAL